MKVINQSQLKFFRGGERGIIEPSLSMDKYYKEGAPFTIFMEPLIPYFDISKIRITEGVVIQTMGLLVLVGVIAGTLVAARKARRDGLEPGLIYGVIPWVFFGIVIGGHLGHLLFYRPRAILSDPWIILRYWDGLSSFGGFIMCTVFGVLFFRHERRKRQASGKKPLTQMHFWAYADTLVYGFALGWFLGRMGCFSAHDHLGVETNFILGMKGICPSGDPDVACHDLGLYESLYSLLTFVAFVILDRRPRFPGFFVAALTVSYGLGRFMMDFLRLPGTDPRHLGLTLAQYGSVLMVVFGVWVFLRNREEGPVGRG
jgi:phosphatidylglycerol:prolipoprotein diacylglycerol transferase